MPYPEAETQPFPKATRLKKVPLPGYSGLYLSAAFRNLGMSLIGLFIPLYILKLTDSLPAVFLFYALYHFLVVIFDYPVGLLIKNLGIDVVSFIGAVFRGGFIYCLLRAGEKPLLLWVGAAIWGITVVLTWLPFHYAFTIAEKEDHKYGKEVSRLEIINRLTGLIGPAAGGIIITFLGFRSLFSASIILTIVSGMPLFFDTLRKRGMRLSLAKVKDHLTRKKRSQFWLSLVGVELESAVVGLVWPLYIFLIVRNYETLGFIKSGAMLLSIVTLWFLGNWLDQRGKSILHLGTIVNSFNVLLRPFLINPFGLFLADSIYSITGDFTIAPYKSAFYERALKMRKLEFMVEREFVLHAAGVVSSLLLAIMLVLEIPWFWFFALGVVGILLRNYILADKGD